jgi:purine-binding chemotaxis protein CheW
MSKSALYLTVQVQNQQFGLPVANVREIFEPLVSQRVPGASPACRGVVNLRGSVVPVVDLGAALGLRETPTPEARCAVLLEILVGGERTAVGVACDAIDAVVVLAAEQWGSAPSLGTCEAPQQLFGLARSRGAQVLLLDVERVLANVGARAASCVAARLPPSPAHNRA